MSHGVRNSQTQPFLPSTRSPVSSDSTTGAVRTASRMSCAAGAIAAAAVSIVATR
jgi:hypothetical protein